MADISILIVDDVDPKDQADRMKQAMRVAGLKAQVRFASSPAQMVQDITQSMPSVILLDHHWPEVSVENVLDDLARVSASTRVVLFTGMEVNPSLVIDCARWGIVEYLRRDALQPDALAKKLVHIANDPNNTLERLRAPSGSVRQLIQEATKTSKELEVLKDENSRLKRELDNLRSVERREMLLHLFRFVSAVIFLVLSFVAIYVSLRWDNSWVVLVLGLTNALVGLIIFDRALSRIELKWGKSKLAVSRIAGKNERS